MTMHGSKVNAGRGVALRTHAASGPRNSDMLEGKIRRVRFARLAHMSWEEFETRSRQEIAKRWDAALYRFGVRFSADGSVAALSERRRRSETAARAKPKTGAPPRFFFSSGDLPRLIALLRERLPHEADQMIEEADRICRHRFDLLGYRDLDYGPEIDWHLDAVHGKRAPRKPWFKIRCTDFGEVGDSKLTWELNRHQHLVTLAKAYCLTQEKRFAAELLRQWYHWRQENPYPIGLNWASSLEVAFRSLSWLWVRHLLTGSSAVPESFELDLLQALALNGRHIERYLSTYSSPNTHLLGEGVALFFIGTLCPELPAARRWQQHGWEIVVGEAEHQVQPDGMHFEQSTYYHVYALDFFLHARALAALNQIPIPAAFDRTIEKMLEALCAVAQAGRPPRFGDDDGGRVFNPRRNRPEHLLDPLATGAVVFGSADFKAAARGLREETLWLLGPKGVVEFEELRATKPSAASVRFESSGIHVMVSSKPVPQQLVIDAGPQGTGTAGHGHADALSVQLSVNGRERLADPGTFCYISSGKERDLFRGTAAHNTLQVDSLSQADPEGPFAWRSLPSVRVEQWAAGRTFDLFAGSHTGYCRLAQPVVHRRWVFHLKSRFWLVRDLVLGEGVHQLDLFWHLAPGLLPRDTVSTAPGVILFSPAGNAESKISDGLAFLPVENHGWSQEVIQGKLSPVYGREEPSRVLHFSTSALVPVEFAVLLLPVEEAFEKLGVLTQIDHEGKNAPVRGYRYDTDQGCHYVFFAEGSKRWDSGPCASDAQFLYWGIGRHGDRRHLVACGPSYVEIGGRQVIAFKQAVDRFDCVGDGKGMQIFCSHASALSHLDFGF